MRELRSVGEKAGAIEIYLWHPGSEPELVEAAGDMPEAMAIAEVFNDLERAEPTGGRLFIEVHQNCTKKLRTA